VRITALDGLRGFALILVLLFHTFSPFTYGGFIGVDIFFVLSGFLITHILISEYSRNNKINLKFFYIRRVLRLAPALLIVTMFYLLYTQTQLIGAEKEDAWWISFSTIFYFGNWLRAFDISSLNQLGHTWSLSIEEQFYLLWPLAIILAFKKLGNKKTIILTCISIVVILWINRGILVINDASIHRLYFATDTHIDGLLIGGLAAMLMNWYIVKKPNFISFFTRYNTHISYLSFTFYIISTLVLNMWLREIYIFYYPILSIITAILITSFYITKGDKQNYLFSNKWIVWLGSISYGVYLWHWLIYRILASYNIEGLIMGFYGSIVAILLASVSFYMVEKPILKHKSKFHP